MMPSKWLTVLQNMNCQTEQQIVNVSPRISEAVVKINNIAEVFNDLASVFGDITTATKMKIHDDELARTLSVEQREALIRRRNATLTRIQ